MHFSGKLVIGVLVMVGAGVTAVAGEAQTTPAAFAKKPTAGTLCDKTRIDFAVTGPTDVAVAIEDAQGKVIRHLAAGVLGKNAPAPLQKDSLAQSLLWDGKDDDGKPAAGGPFKVRVCLGATPKLDKIVGWDGATLGSAVQGLAVGKDGELYVLDGDRGWGRSNIRVFSREGKYVRTIMPYPAGTPRSRLESVGILSVEGDSSTGSQSVETLPIVFGAHSGQVMPLTCGMRSQTMAFSPRGHLLLFSAVGMMAEHGPPRHLLAMHPDGGAPEGVNFVGPLLRKPIGFRGGAGERDCEFSEHMAVSPDGERIYLTASSTSSASPLRHVVFTARWTDVEVAVWLGKDGESGNDDAHLADPQGLATDAKGNLYVCDRGNNRVMVFAADGPPAKPLGKFAVEFPYEIAVHPQSGEIYVLTKKAAEKKGDKIPPVALLKFAAWAGPGRGEPKQLARLDNLSAGRFVLDAGASPVRLWASGSAGVFPITDRGSAFEVGEPITRNKGLNYPMFLAADPPRGRVLIREKPGGLFALDLESGELSPLPVKGADMVLDRDGNIYVMDGYGTNSLSRYAPDGKPLPFASTGSHTLATGLYRGYGPNMGLRGHCVAPNGDLYVIRSNNNNYGGVDGQGTESVVDVFAPDGSSRKRSLLVGMGAGDCGLGVDAAGNVYVGMNIKPPDAVLPKCFEGKVRADNWKFWNRGSRNPPWHYMYQNTYLTHLGSVFKFGPDGGQVYGWWPAGKGDGKAPPYSAIDKAPKEAVAYKTSCLTQDLRVVGARWRYAGMSPIPATDFGSGDSGCVCMTSRLAVDEYGRVFVPNAFRFSVEMLDTNGNQIARIGRYGNADSAGPGSKIPQPEIAFVWPAFVSAAGDKLYVCDTVSRRVTVVRLAHAAEETCDVK